MNEVSDAGAVRFFGPYLYRSVFYSETEEQGSATSTASSTSLMRLWSALGASAMVRHRRLRREARPHHFRERVRDLSERIVEPALRAWAEKHPSVGDVRGRGLFWAVELVRDRETRKPLIPFNASGADAAPMGALAADAKKGGVWPFTHFNRTHIAPPLVISGDDLEHGLVVLDEALTVADGYTTA